MLRTLRRVLRPARLRITARRFTAGIAALKPSKPKQQHGHTRTQRLSTRNARPYGPGCPMAGHTVSPSAICSRSQARTLNAFAISGSCVAWSSSTSAIWLRRSTSWSIPDTASSYRPASMQHCA
jgi:hypothetical protein